MHKEDLALVRRLLKGDEASFNVFYNTYFPRLFRFCNVRMNDTEACKDVVQQSLSNAMRALSGYRGEASLHTWLCQISRNEISSWYKKVGKKQDMTSSLDDNPDLLAAIESLPLGINGELESPHEDVLKSLVQTSLDMLPSAYGTALELKYIEGLSVAEIAVRFELGEVAIQSLLARARKAFKDVFSDLQSEYKSA